MAPNAGCDDCPTEAAEAPASPLPPPDELDDVLLATGSTCAGAGALAADDEGVSADTFWLAAGGATDLCCGAFTTGLRLGLTASGCETAVQVGT